MHLEIELCERRNERKRVGPAKGVNGADRADCAAQRADCQFGVVEESLDHVWLHGGTEVLYLRHHGAIL